MGISFSSFTTAILDGSAPVDPAARIKNLAVLGYYTAGSNGDVIRVNANSDLDTLLGIGPVRDFVELFYAEAKNKSRGLTVIFSDASAAGTLSAVTQVGTGPAATVQGEAVRYVEPMVKIILGGDTGTATCQVSFDGGENYGATQTIAVNGIVTLATDLGITITFTTAVNPLVADDTYAWSVKPTGLEIGDADTAGSIHKALVDYFADESITSFPEAIHIADYISAANINALNTIAGTRLTAKQPVLITGEFRRLDWSTSETVAEYVTAIKALFADANATAKKWIGLVLGFPTITTYDSLQLPMSPAGMIYGVMERLPKISDSTGATKVNGGSNKLLTTVHSLQFSATQCEELNELGGSLIRKHDGASGYYCTRMGGLGGATSVYQAFDRMRVMVYAVGVTFAKLFDYVDTDLDGDDAVSMEPTILSKLLTAYIKQEVGRYVADAAVDVPDDDEDALTADIQLQYRRKASEITANLAMTETITLGEV